MLRRSTQLSSLHVVEEIIFCDTHAFKVWQASAPTTSGNSVGTSAITALPVAAVDAAVAGLTSVVGSLHSQTTVKVYKLANRVTQVTQFVE